MNWEWYWRVKKKHTPKKSCSGFWLSEIDSFWMYKSYQIKNIKESVSKLSLSIPRYELEAYLQDDNSLLVTYTKGSYRIPVERKPCNFGGYYYFFHCPKCDIRMRKLYCLEGQYLCRKCANLGYYSQRLRPSDRCLYMRSKVEKLLHNQSGSLDKKPPWKKQHTFQKIRKKYLDYDEKYFYASQRELIALHNSSIANMLDHHYSIFMSSDFFDLYDYKEN